MFDEKLYKDTFSQIHAPEETLSEVLKMTKKKTIPVIRLTRLIVIAAIITVMLATTAFAYVGFTQYENPMQMLKTFFGEEYHVDEGYTFTETYYDQVYNYVVPTEEHVPINTKVAEEDVAPYISGVGNSITDNGDTLTVQAHLYDSATDCGIIYIILENPDGVGSYNLQWDGEVWWQALQRIEVYNCFGKSFIIEEETTETKLSIAHYYCGLRGNENCIRVGFGGVDKFLYLPLEDGGGMKAISISDDLVQISPIAMKLKISELEFLGRYEPDGTYVPPVDSANIWNLSIRYQDGTEYVIERNDPYTINYMYALGDYTYLYYTFNRLIDVDKIEAVIINDYEFANVVPLSQEQHNQAPETRPEAPPATEPVVP